MTFWQIFWGPSASALLYRVLEKQEKIMAAIDDLRAANQRAMDAIAGIRGDIQLLKDLLANAGSGGLSAEETAEAIALTNALADTLSGLDSENPPPAP